MELIKATQDDLIEMPAFFPAISIKERAITITDLQYIMAYDIFKWSQEVGLSRWHDEWLPWDSTLPIPVRAMIVNDVMDGLQVKPKYLVPIRHLGRVILVAFLPEPPKPVEITFAPTPQPLPRPAPRHHPIDYIDPPLPFLSLGVCSGEVRSVHIGMINQILRDQMGAAQATLLEVSKELAKEGKITCSEFFYYHTFAKSVITGSWRSVVEFFRLAELERNLTPGIEEVPQHVAYAVLSEGRPVERRTGGGQGR